MTLDWLAAARSVRQEKRLSRQEQVRGLFHPLPSVEGLYSGPMPGLLLRRDMSFWLGGQTKVALGALLVAPTLTLVYHLGGVIVVILCAAPEGTRDGPDGTRSYFC